MHDNAEPADRGSHYDYSPDLTDDEHIAEYSAGNYGTPGKPWQDRSRAANNRQSAHDVENCRRIPEHAGTVRAVMTCDDGRNREPNQQPRNSLGNLPR